MVIKYVNILLLGTFTAFLIGCGSCVHGDSQLSVVEKLPRQSFMLIKNSMVLQGCVLPNDKGEKEECNKAKWTATSSGMLVRHSEITPDVSYVITAGHSCEERKFKKRTIDGVEIQKVGTSYEVINYHGVSHQAVVIKINRRWDLCLLQVKGVSRKIKAVPIAEETPRRGVKYYNFAAPRGLFGRGMVLIFDGYYSGNFMSGYDVYTITTKPGSSGSAILNEDGEIVGVIFAGFPNVENVGLSPVFGSISVFVSKAYALGELKLWKLYNMNADTTETTTQVPKLKSP
tara:strand:- start:2554 stop:3414 length:861 start_codon:yes stop_codon:yes gene_type:complete